MSNDNIPPEVYNFLNNIIDGQVEDYIVSYEGNTEKGANFLGDILFINLKNKSTKQDVRLVIKQTFPTLADNPMFAGVYKNEIRFYQDIWKKFDDFQKAHNVGFDKIAKCFGCDSTEGSEKIALDNLKYYGYVLHDKNKPLTKDHVELIMKCYGTYHAISFAFRELHPEDYASLVDPCKSVSFSEMAHYYPIEFENLVQILENEVDDKILGVLKRYVTEAGKIFVDCLNYKGDTPLLIQGDCWSNNMMFKFNDRRKVIDMRFLDFQFARSGSPVNDLSYSIYSGASKDIIDNLDFYLKIYHDSFSTTLRKFGIEAQDRYPFEKLKKEWKEYCMFGFLMGVAIWRMKYGDKNAIPSFKEGNDPNPRTADLIPVAADKVDLHKQAIKNLFRHAFENGFLP